jgi:hypothetical protein
MKEIDFISTGVISVFPDKVVKSLMEGKPDPYCLIMKCSHQTMTKKTKKRSMFVDYKPTPNELDRIKSHPNFSGFDNIDSIKICTVCGVIVAHNKETEFSEKDDKELSLKKKIARKELYRLYRVLEAAQPTIEDRECVKTHYKRAKALLK